MGHYECGPLGGKVSAADSPAASIPAITPPPGSTPAAVALSGSWHPESSKAWPAWPASTNAHLAGYSVRGCAGGGYSTGSETVIADVPSTQLTYETDWGLAAPGSKAAFKVYVVTDTGNEKGSNALSITRPTVP